MPLTAAGAPAASLRSRIGGYVVDMVIFSVVAMLVLVVAGIQLLIITHGAENDSTKGIYGFLAIIGMGTPLVWSALNLFLLITRRQTGGEYVAGIRLAREDGTPLTGRHALAWWFCFNPLLFSWPMAIVTGLPLAATISLIISHASAILSHATVLAFGVLVTICVVAPLIAVVSAAFDSQNRTLHDRIVGIIAVPAD